MIEYDFHALLGVDLSETIRTKSFRWFLTRLRGVLSDPSSRLAAHFADSTPETEAPDGG